MRNEDQQMAKQMAL